MHFKRNFKVDSNVILQCMQEARQSGNLERAIKSWICQMQTKVGGAVDPIKLVLSV